MKKVLLSCAIAAVAAIAAVGQVTELRQVTGFTGIDASSIFNIVVEAGEAEKLVIEADEELLPFVRSEVRKNVLHLWVDRDKARLFDRGKTVKIAVTMRNLELVHLSGACKLVAEDLFEPASFKGDFSGATSVSLNLNTGSMNVDASGACLIRLKGSVAGKVNLDASGASKITAELDAGELMFDASGVCAVELTGRADRFSVDVSGTAKVKAESFTARNVRIESSGASKISVYATDTLEVDSSGASSISYKGAPAITRHGSGASKIKSI